MKKPPFDFVWNKSNEGGRGATAGLTAAFIKFSGTAYQFCCYAFQYIPEAGPRRYKRSSFFDQRIESLAK
jgi:hypothetical protein